MTDNDQVSAENPWLNTLTGTCIRVKTPGAETENRVTVIEYIEPPNSQPPVFTKHEFVEVFCVLSGTLTFQFLNEPRFTIAAGENVTCPPWKPHSFWNETNQPVTALLVCTPAGLDQFFTESHRLLQAAAKSEADNGSLHSDMKNLRTLHGLEHVGDAPVVD